MTQQPPEAASEPDEPTAYTSKPPVGDDPQDEFLAADDQGERA